MGAWIQENHVTIFHSTPTVYRYFIDTLEEEIFDCVRLVVLGGEEVLKSDIEKYKKHFASDCVFVNGLGPSESTLAFQNFINQESEIDTNSIPVGHPVEGIELVLLDDSGNQTEVFGEIALLSRQVALGYWNMPEMTAEVFTEMDGHKRLYRTGDLGRVLPDGKLVFCGRKDLQVKIRGYRIEPSDVEIALNRHRSVQETVVVSQKIISGENRLVAFIRPFEKDGLNLDRIRSYAKNILPDYMVPEIFIPIGEIPLTPTGKVDRKALLSEIGASYKEENSGRIYVSPKNEMERKLVQVWRDILSADQISINDNFFEIGGHSLLLAKAHGRLLKEGIQIELTDMFKYPTIRALAHYVSDEGKTDTMEAVVSKGSERAKRRQSRRAR
jgi:acyl-coenzyme A synthetase/AMP-(fatty) acid ligase/aryl carrier-like protein